MIPSARHDEDPDRDALLDELVQAHLDTIELTLGVADDRSWIAHVGYLQDLVRHAKRASAVDEAVSDRRR
jgi:hypothetical protein